MAVPVGALDRRRVGGAAPSGVDSIDRGLPSTTGVVTAPAPDWAAVRSRRPGRQRPTDAASPSRADTRRRITARSGSPGIGQGLAALDDAVVGDPALCQMSVPSS